MRDVKMIRGADARSDHELVLCELQLNISPVQNKMTQQLLDSRRPNDGTVKPGFTST